MQWIAAVLLVAFLAPLAAAQAPAVGPGSAEDAVVRKQREASAAYRDLEQAQYEAKLAEQDVLNLQDAVKSAPAEQAAERKRQLGEAGKVYEAARAKAEKARKRYEAALTAVDEAFGKPGSK